MSPKRAKNLVTFYIPYSILFLNTVLCYKSVHFTIFLFQICRFRLTCIYQWRIQGGALGASSTYISIRFWIYPIRARTLDLSHLRRGRLSIYRRCSHSISVIFMTTLVSHQSKSRNLLNTSLPSTDENMHNEYNWIHFKYYKLTMQYKVIDSTISNNLFISRIL